MLEPAEKAFAEEEELTKTRNDRRLKQKHSSTGIASFWLPIRQEYPIITKKATEARLPFSASCLCEAGFSAANTMKSKNRLCFQTLEEDLRVHLLTIRPRTRDIMRHHQAQFYAYINT
jgi:hypothetical protein